MKNSVFQCFRTMILGIVLLGLCQCKLSGTHANIYPSNGSMNIPVNTSIEVQYPPELGATLADMKKNLFSINECDLNTFSYFDTAKTKENPATDKKDDETKKDEKAKKDDGTSAPTLGTSIDFYWKATQDVQSGIIFNFLVINPKKSKTPLEPGHTYCVTAKKISKPDGTVIVEENTNSFTVEENASVEFDSQPTVEFFVTNVAPTRRDQAGKLLNRDYAIVYLRDQSINPNDFQTKIKLCLYEPLLEAFQGNCGNFKGEVVPSDVYLIEGLRSTNDTDPPLSEYHLYLVTAQHDMKVGEKYKILFDSDLGKEFAVTDLPNPIWENTLQQTVLDGSGESEYSPISVSFYVGAGSNTTVNRDRSVSGNNASANSRDPEVNP